MMMAGDTTVAEKVCQITGTHRSIIMSSNPIDLDEEAVEELRQINNLTPRDAVKTHNDFLNLEPENIPGDRLFLCQDPYGILLDTMNNIMQPTGTGTGTGKWKIQGSPFGYGVGNFWIGYRGLKQSYVYHKGDHKTNWIMNIYSPITEDVAKADAIVLCRVFQSDGISYNSPKRPVLVQTDFQASIYYMETLESLIQDPNAFKDSDEGHENSGAYSAPKGKRSAVWKDFTEIKVLGPNGEVVLTLAICHHCNMVYKTGGLKANEEDPTESDFRNYGTKTLKGHKRRCMATRHQHTAGNPQGVLP